MIGRGFSSVIIATGSSGDYGRVVDGHRGEGGGGVIDDRTVK